MGFLMGLPNLPNPGVETGLNHTCWPAGYAPLAIVCEYNGASAAPWILPGKPLPSPQIGTLYHISETIYLGNTSDLTIIWTQTQTSCIFQSYFKIGGACNQGGLDNAFCPIAAPGASGSPHMWEGGTYSLRINDPNFLATIAPEYGEELVIPEEADIFSEVQNSTDEHLSIRWARHKDKTNLLVKFDI